MRAVLYFIISLALIAGGFFGGKLFEKPQVINSFNLAQPVKSQTHEEELLALVKRVQEVMIQELNYHHHEK